MTVIEKYAPPILSVVLVALIALTVKYFTKRKCKKPNGKRGALMSLTVATAFALVVAATVITKDPVTCIVSLLLASALVKTKLDLKQFTTNQMIGSASVGVIVGAVAWFIVDGKIGQRSSYSSDRDVGDAPPRPEMDMRAEADSAPSSLDLKTPSDDGDSGDSHHSDDE